MSSSPRVLITGAGGSISLNVARSLVQPPSSAKLFAVDSNRYFIHLSQAEQKAVIPSAAETQAYLKTIRTLVAEWKIDVIFPSNMLEVLVLARERETLGARTLLPSLSAIEIGADKWRTYEVLSKAGVPVPKTLLVKGPEDLKRVFSDFGDPIWLRGSGIPGRGVGVASLPARTEAQAHAWLDYHQAWGMMTASEFLPGDNLTWMGLWKDGELIASQGRKRLAYVISHVSPSGITGAPSVSCTVHDERINEIGAEAMRLLDPQYTGVGFVDFKSDVTGDPKVTEVNVGRLGTTHYFYTEAGSNFPHWYVQLAMGEKPQVSTHANVVPAGLYWIRTLDSEPALVKESELDRYAFERKR